MITLSTTISNNGSIASASPQLRCAYYLLVYRLLFNIAVSVELADVGPHVLDLLLVLDAGEDHFGAGYLCLWVFNVVLERLFVPHNA